MPKFAKPWFRKGRGWYVTVDGKQVPLGADRKSAFAEYHKLMQQPREAPKVRGDSVAVIVDHFLDWAQKNRAADTYGWYRQRLEAFCQRYPDLTVEALRPFHVQEWIDSVDRSSGTRRNYARSIQRAIRWAKQMGYIDQNPIADFKKPKGGTRTTVISPEEFVDILAAIPSAEFRDLLTFAWETGARAAECLAIEKRHVDLAWGRIIFPVEEEKMERAPRIIYLNEVAFDIIRRLVLKNPDGKVFRNTAGKAWTTEAVNCAFVALQHRLGQAAMKAKGIVVAEDDVAVFAKTLKPCILSRGEPVPKCHAELLGEARRKLTFRLATMHAPKYCLTIFRHSWCHRALRRGVDALTVSVLMGHADPSMIAKVYSHLSHAPEYLREAVKKATA